ncbi:MAG: thiolase family protein [Ignavibacteria bacterium]|jgi:acetyl-CoA C-acetyltransferase|nr:thiolase family protein [Ignavibacteria bacterium]
MRSVILSAARTPIGSFLGSLSNFSAPQLGSKVIAEAIRRASISKEEVSEVIIGQVLTAGAGQAPGRQAAIYAGLPSSVPCLTINKVCGSGLKALMLADQSIKCKDSEIVVAGGQESMSSAPYLLFKARNGLKMGNTNLIDSMISDGLWDVYNDIHMGEAAELCASKYSISRQEQDDYAIQSYKRAIEAQNKGFFNDEIFPIIYETKKGKIIVEKDEEPEKANFSKFPSLKPVFKQDGTITAANASSINDGAAAIVLCSEEKAKELGKKPLARIIAYSSFSQAPEWFSIAPVGAIKKVLEKAEMSINKIDLFEINEAFSVVPLAIQKEIAIPMEKMNIAGGALSLGHPIGASGARILITLIYALKRENKRYGLASLCIGGGEAVAMIIENI